jgi:hypothetical protein
MKYALDSETLQMSKQIIWVIACMASLHSPRTLLTGFPTLPPTQAVE